MNTRYARTFFAITLLLSPALVVAQSDKTDKPPLLPDDQKVIQRILSVAPAAKR